MDSNTFYIYAGFDALVFRLFLISCFKFSLWCLPYSFIILLPIYATSAKDDDDDWLDILSLNTIPKQSNRLYATVIGSYLFSFIALYYLSNTYLKIAYITDKYHIADTAKMKNIDKLSWLNYQKSSKTLKDSVVVNTQYSINNAIDLNLNRAND